MAKRKKKPAAEKEWTAGKPMALQMRGSPDWKQWLEELAEFDRSSVSDVADRAIAAYARTVGFPKQPPPR